MLLSKNNCFVKAGGRFFKFCGYQNQLINLKYFLGIFHTFLKGNIVKSRSEVKNERYFPLLLGSTTSRELGLLCKVCKDVTNIYVTS